MSNFMSNSDALQVLGTYAEDIKKGKGVIAVRETSPATAAHGVGEYIRYNGTTYKVKSAISIGDSLILNTNIEANGLPNGTTIFTPETVGDPTVAFLNDLGDVDISNPQNGQVPMYNSGTGKFENADLPDGEAVFTITLTGDGDTTPYSVDKTPEEVAEAYSNGSLLIITRNGTYAYLNGVITFSGTTIYAFNSGTSIIDATLISSNSKVSSIYTNTIMLTTNDGTTWNNIHVSRDEYKAQDDLALITASADVLGRIYQHVGATANGLTHNYFYECVSDGGDPASYEWQRIDVQPGSDVSGKADKVSGATNGNFAALNSSGNLTDSGKKAGDFVLTTAIGTAAAKDVPTSGNASASQVVMGNDTRLSDARTPASHNQAASTITAGTLAGRVQANATAAATLANAQVRDVVISTTDLTPGTSALAAGSVYIVYE